MSDFPPARLFDRTTPPHIVTLVLLAGISAMTMSIFLPSLPRMTEEFQTDYAVMQLSVSAYLACTALLQIVFGPLSDRFGRRKITLWGIGLFGVATLGCLLSTSVEMFLAFRMMQAAAAVGMVLSRAIVRDIVPGAQAASMIGYVTMGMSLVPMIAPLVGGLLDEAFGWRTTFAFLLVSGIGLWTLCLTDLGETNRSQAKSFAAQIADYPTLFRARRFWGYALSAAFSSGAFFAFLGGAPYVATEVYGLSPTITGIFFGAPAVGYFLGNLISGRFSVRLGIDRMILIGCVVVATGMTVSITISLLSTSSALLFFGFCTFVGLGNGMVLPNATAGLLGVRPELAGTASGIGSAVMIGGGAALAAIAGPALQMGTTSLPLQAIMLASSLMSLVCILYVIRRAKSLPT